MGYDMHWADQLDYSEPGYFRLNISGMGWCYDEMARRGMVFEASRDGKPEWPDVDYDLRDRLHGWGDPLEGAELDQATREDKELRAYLAYHGPEIPGIPGWKFSTNDGWIVTPPEIAYAVKRAREIPAPRRYPNIWRDWVNWMEQAAKHGGFEVH